MHSWNLEPSEAIRIQSALRQGLLLAWDDRSVCTVAGADVSYKDDLAYAAITLLDFPALTLRLSVTVRILVHFPYIPGLLAFREGPPVLAAWEQLPLKPDLVICDGHGIAHPRGLGLASHLGLWLATSTIGVAKSCLYGQHDLLGDQAGDQAELHDEVETERVIGVALRTSAGAKPVYVSPGHLVDLGHAVTFVLACCLGNRIPEPLRLAHQVAKRSAKAG